MKRRETGTAERPAKSFAEDPDWQKKYPAIWEHLTLLTYEDGTARELSKLSIFVQDDRLKLSLSDPDAKASCYVSGESVNDALKALEVALASDRADWRKWSTGKKK